MKSANDIREGFLSFFEAKDHRRVASSSLVPHGDPSLLFTNAGMNQFKNTFLGIEPRPYQRAVTSQKCMRVSGKHNDLEEVGRTPRHHTFFEMLGNFSFGNYFKKEAIDFAWELVTQVYGLPPGRLLASVFEEDDEAYDLWTSRIGLPADRVFRLGASENFWSMGDTGPCGPCSEIHVDLRQEPTAGETITPDSPHCLEVWNLVFMQFDRDASGQMAPLPSPSIDTGMGLERIACVLQGVASNYDTDLFTPIIQEAAGITGREYGEGKESDVSLRILADHSRACAFLITDGVAPANEGRGYVLRKILRRAIRHGRMLGVQEPFFYLLVAQVADLMKNAYPELASSREYASRLVRAEEEKFSSTLDHGLQLLEELFETAQKKGQKELPGPELFRLYDTYGFPLDLVREISQERGFSPDETGFYREMEKQRERARASWKGAEVTVSAHYRDLADEISETEFTGYEEFQNVSGEVLALLREGERVESLSEQESGELILDRTPFYAESGGQVGDTGKIEGVNSLSIVHDTHRPVPGIHVHRITVQKGTLHAGEEISSTIDLQRRHDIARNHTGTHLLHAALRDVLGVHVKQAGSLVAPQRLRFDFTHFQPLSSREMGMIEELVNAKIRDNLPVSTHVRDLEEALAAGAMALFGEKYGERVRTVAVPDFSLELCGGTHVRSTGEIALFKFVHEGSISAGVRRVEAVTGEEALHRFMDAERVLANLSAELRVSRDTLEEAIRKQCGQLRETQRRIDELQHKLAGQHASSVLSDAREVRGVSVIARRVEGLDRAGLRSLADQVKNKLDSGVVVLGAPSDGKVSLVAMVSSDLTGRIRANDLIARIARTVKGGGGGRPDMAEAGGTEPALLDKALEQTFSEVEAILS